MSIYIACDHRGIELKKRLIEELSKKYNIISSNVENNENDDYPDFAFDVCTKMSKEEDYAILICGNGIGISIAANKVKGIRCARVINEDDVKKAKEHNHVNAISIPADMSLEESLIIVNLLISTKSSTLDRHVRRVNKIIRYEKGEYNEI